MRIATIQAAYNAHQINRAGVPGRTNAAGRASDTVSISPAAADYATALRAVQAVPDTREGLVNNIRNMINSGTYNVSDREIAERIFQETR